MRRVTILILALVSIFLASGKSSKVQEATIHFGTYNVWGNRQRNSEINKYKRAPQERSWENSRDIVAQMIVDAEWDIFGVQEGGNLVREELPKLVKQKGGRYKWWFQRPDPSVPAKGDKNLANGIVWRSDRFKLSNKQVFWLSPTPDTPSKAWEEKVRHWRFVMSATVKDKKTGVEFIFMVTHCPLMRSTREKSAKLIIERERQMNPEGKVVVLVGDMNSQPHMPFSQIIKTHFTDSRDIAKQRSEVSGTFNGSRVSEKMPSRTLDYIYIRGDETKYEVLEHKVFTDKYEVNGKSFFPSDHCPVGAKVKITK